jgi:Flp pilus assembly secretin CpaC
MNHQRADLSQAPSPPTTELFAAASACADQGRPNAWLEQSSRWLIGRPGVGRWITCALFAVTLSSLSLAAWKSSAPDPAQGARPILPAAVLQPSTTSPRSAILKGEERSLAQHTHLRLVFERDIERIASGAPQILEHVETLSTREVLMLAGTPGHTSVLVWYQDGEIEQIEVTVTEDLTLLQSVLADIHPGIRVQKAPDREAWVLLGSVPKAIYSRRAEDIAESWLGATSPSGELLVGDAARLVEDAQSSNAAGTSRGGGTGAVINLIRIEGLPEFGALQSSEELFLDAISSVGGEEVRIRRIQKGPLPDDSVDILVLEGEVRDQVALSRVLSLAYKVFVGNMKGEDVSLTDGVTGITRVFEGGNLAIGDDIKVIADEAGALFGKSDDSGSNNLLQGFGRGGGSGGSGGGQGGGLRGGLKNDVQANIARASAIELAGGRIMSFIEVTDLPQVRVDIRLYEVNRTKLLSYQSDLGIINSDFNQGGLQPAGAASILQGGGASSVGSGGSGEVQNVFGFLGGIASNQLQISGSNFAIDWTLSMLESEGIARSLANPSLSVLSGEVAIFEVGGRIPVDQAFGTQVGIEGVFSSTSFIEFGVNLAIRPLVGKDDYITIDFAPEVSTPDALLTQLLVEATGKSQSTFAFESRLLKTSARLLDGQTLLVGGLSQNSRSDTDQKTPWLSKLPLVGLLFQGLNYADDDLQVVILIRPTIQRDPLPDAALWEYPSLAELMGRALPKGPRVMDRATRHRGQAARAGKEQQPDSENDAANSESDTAAAGGDA